MSARKGWDASQPGNDGWEISDARWGQPTQGSAATAVGGKRSGLRAIPLRVSLVLLIVMISGVGLACSSVAVSSIMRTVVFSRVDDELQAVVNTWTQNSPMFSGSITMVQDPSNYCLIRVDAEGNRVAYYGLSDVGPDISSVVVDGKPHTVGSVAEETTSSEDTEGTSSHIPSSSSHNTLSTEWRVVGISNADSTVTYVAKPLTKETLILKNLVVAQVVISALVLLVLGLFGSYLIYRALRPLHEVENTARRIAGGDHSRRVPQWPMNTEVGQLAFALNTMLARLQESIEEARSKEDQMRRFVGDASHELRTPLTSVRGYAELYRSGATKDIDLVLGRIDQESQRMSSLVEDLLALTRAEGQQLEMHNVDMLELSLGVASTARGAFPDRTVAVENLADNVPMVLGDGGRLHQVLLNLVTNGIRHGGDNSSVTIRLKTSPAAAPGAGSVIVEVADDGRGMSPEVSAHVFERFYREDASRSRASGGSGLGLAITKSIVEKHGGTISVDSTPGVGTVFSVVLPRVDGSAPAQEPEQTDPESSHPRKS